MKRNLNELEEIIGYKFNNLHLLDIALIHKSACNKTIKESERCINNYERLEFVGDSVIGLIASKYIYDNFPDKTEGEMSKIKDKMVSDIACTIYSKSLDLEKYMIFGKGMSSNSRYHIGDLFEAVIGAIYVDSNDMNVVTDIFIRIFHENEDSVDIMAQESYISILQKITHKNFKNLPEYVMIESLGPDHNKEFIFDVYIEGINMGTGTGKSKKLAKLNAARNAVEFIRTNKYNLLE